jgi:putative transferase (TIGR04331 family)
MKRFLITTADERMWRTDCPVLFLGEWCRLYDRRAVWEPLDAEVVPYHWDDRRKFDDDFTRLQLIYEDLLCRTSAALNAFHGTEKSIRYWRILVGPWLYVYIHVLFDRWTMVETAADTHDIDETLIADFPPEVTIAPDLLSAAYSEVGWNQYLFDSAIEYQNKIPWRRHAAEGGRVIPKLCARRMVRGIVRTALRDVVSALLSQFTKSDEAMIIRSYLPRREEMKLQLALGQVPKLWTPPRSEAVPPDMSRRRQFKIASNGTSAFCQFAASMIAKQIPTVYLEGYQRLKHAAEILPWPSRPRVIFTSNLFQYCEVFQEWAAEKTEAGHPLVIGQHGGFSGVGKRHPGEDHNVKVSDRYLAWAGQDEGPVVYPAPILTNIGKRVATWNPSGNLLLVTVPIRLLALRNMSWPVGPNQSAKFVGEQLRFARALCESSRASLVVRIDEAFDKKMRTFYVERWKDALPGVEIDPSTEPIENRLRQCRVFVYTYNSTGFLETLARNIPTVMFWNPWYFELRPSARPYFELLAKVQVYHEAPESAARHITQIWPDVAEWWNQPAVQQARRTFCEEYARMPRRPLDVLKKALLTVPVTSSLPSV